MRVLKKVSGIAFCFVLTSGLFLNASAQSNIVGTWQGRIYFMGDFFRIVFHFSEDEHKVITGTFESPEQSSTKLAMDNIEVHGDSLSFDMAEIDAEYQGVYNKDSAAYYGVFNQGGYKIKIKLIKGDASDLLYKRPQKPVKPYPYKEEEVVVTNKKGNLTLAGTFTRPEKKGKYPVVVMITGSGAEDRDESVFGHKPFLIISDYLTRRGIAVLRCDDRGTGASTGHFESATITDFASDVNAQIDYLKTRKDVDVKRIGLMGHSEGGVIAPLVASQRKDVAFVVMLAGLGIKMFDDLLLQDSLISVSEGTKPKRLEKLMDANRKIYKILETEKDSSTAADAIGRELSLIRVPDKEIERNIKLLLSPWMQSYKNYDPKDALTKLRCPVLAINGEKDVQVAPNENIAAIKQAMNGNNNLTASILPGLNHLFQQCTKCNIREYSKIEMTIDPVALNTIGEWMDKNVLMKK